MPPAHTVDSWVRLALLALAVGAVPLAWWWLRQRDQRAPQRLAAITALILFLTFDLIVFGAFTRLSDSGLGCPDWPGCYGQASPLGAQADIHAAQAVMPDGPVTWGKAWIEMVHRYLAMGVGVLIIVAAVGAWRHRRQLPHSPLWAMATLAWVIVQGLFGKYTVTLKLYPAIVTLHLLGAMTLLALLAIQLESFRKPDGVWRLPVLARTLAWVALPALALQIALGGWVSTNYAVLACQGFPSCNGEWWPAMDLGNGFTLLRALGHTGQGAMLPFEALVAIHLVHRAFAVVAAATVLCLAFALRRDAAWRAWASLLVLLVLAQWATGVSNVVLRWPLLGALMHTGGAALLVLVLVRVLARDRVAQRR
jgi:cytochrome c oxidase assembly protein subunit 15